MFANVSKFVKALIGVSALTSVSTVLSACYGPPPRIQCPTERYACYDAGSESMLWHCVDAQETVVNCTEQGKTCVASEDGASGQCVDRVMEGAE